MLSFLDYQQIFQTLPALYMVLDPAFNICEVSDKYLEASMRTRGELLGKPVFEAFPENPADIMANGAARLRASLMYVAEHKKIHVMPLQRYDIREPAEKGGAYVERYWMPKNIPVVQDGQLKYILHVVEDVTSLLELTSRDKAIRQKNSEIGLRLEEMEERVSDSLHELSVMNEKLRQVNTELMLRSKELERSNLELSNFAMTASHDIKAPFRVVGNYIGLIESKLRNKGLLPEYENYFSRIYSARERIAALLDDLLDFAMVSHKVTPLENVDSRACVQSALDNLESVIQETSAQIEISGSWPKVRAVPSQLGQLFQNLIANGLKFNSGVPHISISVQSTDKHYVFCVRDNGIGIEEIYFERIFNVFQRLNSSADYKGTGLGLAICKRIVTAHGGAIWLESTPGEGTAFYFSLPR